MHRIIKYSFITGCFASVLVLMFHSNIIKSFAFCLFTDCKDACQEVFDVNSQLRMTHWMQYNKFLESGSKQSSLCTEYKYTDLKEFLSNQSETIKFLGYDPGIHLEDYNYSIHHSQTGYFVTVTIIEFFKQKLTSGGSSFYGLAYTENKLALCTYTDHFNGTYTVLCPMSSHCVHVNLTLLHTGFSQYQGITKRLDHVLLDAQICATSTQDCVTLPQHEYWYHDEHHTWKWHSDIDFPVTDEEMCKMLDALGRLFMVGSSHMFYQYRYLLKTCLNSVHDLKHRLFYVEAQYIYEIQKAIQAFMDPKTYNWCLDNGTVTDRQSIFANRLWGGKTKALLSVCNYGRKMNTTVLFQAGSWDVSYKTFQPTLKMVESSLEPVIEALSSFESSSQGLHFLMMGPPPIYPKTQYASCRNNDMLHLFSHALRQICEKHKLRFLSVFEVVYPRYNESVDNSHYLHCGKTCIGEVGKVVTQVALHVLRNDVIY